MNDPRPGEVSARLTSSTREAEVGAQELAPFSSHEHWPLHRRYGESAKSIAAKKTKATRCQKCLPAWLYG